MPENEIESDSSEEVASNPVGADPRSIIDAKVPQEIRDKFEIYSYKNAAVILSEVRATEFREICQALNSFEIDIATLKRAGGNESDIPKQFSSVLRPLGWNETTIQGDLHVRLTWREPIANSQASQSNASQSSSIRTEKKTITSVRTNYLDGHKIDYVKGTVAFDLEWNSKDQTFDRDLYAFNAFFLSGAIDCAVLVTRSASMNDIFRSEGIMTKYGASTTWMGKLLYRLNAGRNGGCPVLVVGITPKCVRDWRG